MSKNDVVIESIRQNRRSPYNETRRHDMATSGLATAYNERIELIEGN